MGEIADMMLDGTLDEQTGEYIGQAVGYPRTRVKGQYNSINHKEKLIRSLKYTLKEKSLGGLHLIGKNVFTEKQGNCIIADCIGKRGKRRYILIDEKGETHKVRFKYLQIKI